MLGIHSMEMTSDVVTHYVGHGGELVESMPFERMVVGSNLALAARVGTLGKSCTRNCLWRFGGHTVIRDVQYVHCVMHKCIMVKLGGNRKTQRIKST